LLLAAHLRHPSKIGCRSWCKRAPQGGAWADLPGPFYRCISSFTATIVRVRVTCFWAALC
jgi:hypothetical protein